MTCKQNTLPARSTRFITLDFLLSPPPTPLVNWSNVMVTTVCALLLVAFMLVDATVRTAVPAHNEKAQFYCSSL